MCSFVIVPLDHFKSAVSNHPQTDPCRNNSKVSVDLMCVLDSLMPSTTIENGVCSFVIVTLDHLKLLKSAVSDHPQTDPCRNNSKVSVDPMCVLDSLMPSTTIENLSRLWPLFFPPMDITTIQRCLYTTDI